MRERLCLLVRSAWCLVGNPDRNDTMKNYYYYYYCYYFYSVYANMSSTR